jgi:hypothetical protein
MAVIEGGTTNVLQDVNNNFKAARMSIYPIESVTWNSIAVQTGLLTAIAANGQIFSFKNNSANLLAVKRVGVGFVCTTAFTAAQKMEFAMMVMRNVTVTASGGTQINITANNGKHRTSLNTPTQIDCRISTTGALTAGTNTPDANDIGIVPFFVGGVGLPLPFDKSALFAKETGDYPLVLAQNESFVIRNLTAMGAAGVGVAYISLEFCELALDTF